MRPVCIMACMRCGFWVMVALLAAGQAWAGGAQPSGRTSTWALKDSDSYGLGIACLASGGFAFAAQLPNLGCGGKDIRVSKLNSSFEQESWYSSIGGGCYWLYVRGVATANDSTYVAFANNMGNTGVAKFSSGGSYDWTYSTGTANNIADVAVDPGDGTIWGLANPGCGMYVCAYLYHLQDDGSWYSTLSNDYCYPSGGNEGRGLCLAVTKDRIYIGGMHWNGLRYAPWLMCLDRGTRTTI